MKRFFTFFVVSLLVVVGASAQRTLVEFVGKTDNTGEFVLGSTNVTFDAIKVNTNTTSVAGVKLASSYFDQDLIKASSDYLIVKTQGGFKAGDVVQIAGAFNNADDSKLAKVDIFTGVPGGEPTVLFTTSQFVNGRLVSDQPVVESYTLTADVDSLCFGRNGNTGTFITMLTISRPGEAGQKDPLSEPKVWNFTQLSDTDVANLAADADNWSYDEASGRYSYVPSLPADEAKANNLVLKANGVELEITKGLLFGRDGTLDTKKVNIDANKRLNFGGGKYRIVINSLVVDDVVTVSYASGKADEARGIAKPANADVIDGSLTTTSTSATSVTFKVNKKGALVIESTASINVFSIRLNSAEEPGGDVINAIRTVKVTADDAAYTLSGQKVGADYKGIVVKAGRKVIVK